MTLLTDATAVFAAQTTGRCAVVFLSSLHARVSPGVEQEAWTGIAATLDALTYEGWTLSTRAMVHADAEGGPVAYATGFAHDIDLAGVFEAPSAAAALSGIVRLEETGWERLASTEWLVGVREFAAVSGHGVMERNWGFLALWEWNDAWCAASIAQRQAYDEACDEAFAADVAAGVDIAGRHRLDWASRWHHLGVWEVHDPMTVDAAMRHHEQVADFKFTTSRHYLGRRGPLRELLSARHE